MGASRDLDAVLWQLSLEEKVSLLSAVDWWRTVEIRRHDKILVPHVKSSDGPNGARGESYVSGVKAACFPCSTSLGASFDVDAVFTTGRYIALEALSKSAKILLAPTVNMIRSPIGGRNYETFSEDPWVLGMLGAAFVRGSQSVGVATTPKHFVANDVEKRRRFLSAEVDERTLREIYLMPFQLILKHGDPWCLMTSYNKVNGTYAAEHPRLLEDIVRKEWGFRGLIMSDWVGTYSTAPAINAGLDLEMPGPTKMRGEKLLKAIKAGEVNVATIDKSARRVLELLKRLGQFEDSAESPEKALEDPERDEFIAQSAAESAVLLKNENGLLPISKGTSIAVIGQHARNPTFMGGGSARVDTARKISVLMGLEAEGLEFVYSPGVPVYNAIPSPEPQMISRPSGFEDESSLHPVRLEYFNSSKIGENPVKEAFLEKCEYMLKERWPAWLDKEYCTRLTFALTPRSTGNHHFAITSTGASDLYINGEHVFHRDQEQNLQREAFYFFRVKFEKRFRYHLEAGKRYEFRLESWATEPDALARTIGGAVIQGSAVQYFEHVDIPLRIQEAADCAAKAEVAVVCTGTTGEIESEGYDREDMNLTADQYDLIAAVASANPRTVVVNFSGAPVSFTPFVGKVSGLLQCWFPGQEAGHAVARLLSGSVNPCGRLPMSWPKHLEDNPSHANFPTDDNDMIRYEEGMDVGYRFYDKSTSPEPLFAFGYGLSYTTFDLENSRLVRCSSDDRFWEADITVDVRNNGPRAGKTVVQLYVEAPRGNVPRPPKELKAFTKPHVQAQGTVEVLMKLDKYSLSYYDAGKQTWVAEKGTYLVHIGFSTDDIRATVPVQLERTFEWQGL